MKPLVKYESGRSMIEMVGVLAVMGLVTAAAFSLVRSSTSSQKRERVQDEIQNIVVTVRGLSSRGQDFSNLSSIANNTTSGRALLENLQIQTQTPFGGDSYYTVLYSSKTQFIVRVVNITPSVCTALKNVAWSGAVSAATCSAVTGNTNLRYLQIKFGKSI